MPPTRRPLRLEAAILSRIRSEVTSRSNWAKDNKTFRVRRASARPSPGLTWLALAAVAVCDLIDAMAVDLFRSELQLEALAHHTGQEAPNRVLLPAGHLHH